MSRSLLSPVALLILVTGCSVQGELEYAQSQNAASAEATKDGGSQRQVQQEETAAGLRMEWASSAGFGRTAAPPPTEENSQSPPVIVGVDSKPQTIHTGDINVHIGDIHHHEHQHVYVGQSIIVATLAADVVAERNAAPTEPEQANVTPLDERCERLRREHEERVADWTRFFQK